MPVLSSSPPASRPSFLGRRAFPAVLFLFVLGAVVFGFTAPIAPARAEAGSDRVQIRIDGHQLQPATLNVVPGTTVLWKNNASGPIRVRFTSQGVSTICKEPRGFGGDVNGIRESSRITGGEFASICFLEPAEYRYRVDFLGPSTESPVEGTIRVALDR